MVNEVIVVEQLPIIREQLELIKDEIQKKTKEALSFECTETTLKDVRGIRANLKKDFEELEKRRKEVKNKILSPYNAFEEIYKECVTNIFMPADTELKQKINDVENHLKEIKKSDIIDYFNEYCASKSIGFLKFEQVNLNITLSASNKALKTQVKLFIDKVTEEIDFINSHENAAEILVEYKKSFDVVKAITLVTERHKAIESEEKRVEDMKAAEQEKQETVNKVINTLQTENIPLSAPKTDDDTTFKMTFTVVATKSKLLDLKHYLIDGGYEIIK